MEMEAALNGIPLGRMPYKVRPAHSPVDIYMRGDFMNVAILIEKDELLPNGKPAFERYLPLSKDAKEQRLPIRWSMVADGAFDESLFRYEDDRTLVGFLLKVGPVPEHLIARCPTIIGRWEYVVHWLPGNYAGMNDRYAALCYMRKGSCSPTHTAYLKSARPLISSIF